MLLVHGHDKIIETETLNVFLEKCIETITINEMKNTVSLFIVKEPLFLYLVNKNKPYSKFVGSIKINMKNTNSLSKDDIENAMFILEDVLDNNSWSWSEFDSINI